MNVAIVTGANKGIGRETVRQLALAGHIVYLGARDKGRGEEAAAELRESGDVRFLHLDVTDNDMIVAAAARVQEEAGYADLLVNNAAVSVGGALPSLTEADAIRQTYETNVIGVVMVTRAFLPLLRRGTEKSIVNVSSELGSLTLFGYPDFPFEKHLFFSYASSKAALNSFTVLLHKELAPEGFKVNSVTPGFTDTDFNNHKGHRSVEQAAASLLRHGITAAPGPSGGFFYDHGSLPW